MKFKIDTRQLAKWRGRMEARKRKVRPAAASTLNYVGAKTVDAMVRQVAAQTGVAEEVVRRFFVIRPASTSKLSFEIDATAAMSQPLRNRPLPARGRRRQNFPAAESGEFFRRSEMVNIVDMGDDKVCEICEDAVEHGPYTIEQARAMIPLHPNCRCVVEPLEERRIAPEARRGSPVRGGEVPPQEAMGELLTRMRGELRTIMARP